MWTILAGLAALLMIGAIFAISYFGVPGVTQQAAQASSLVIQATRDPGPHQA
jgi:hypothetical protein